MKNIGNEITAIPGENYVLNTYRMLPEDVGSDIEKIEEIVRIVD